MKSLTPEETLHYWIEERLRVMEFHDTGEEKPWSADPVFQTTYFCNVRREDDKVTKWIRRVFDNSDRMCAASNMMMARLVNKPESLEKLGWPWYDFHPRKWHEVMSKKGAWGGAYIVSTNGRAMPKHEYISDVLDSAWRHNEKWGSTIGRGTLSGAHSAIQAVQGFGSFLSAQVVADLKNTKGHPLAEAPDWYLWSAHGPGSLRGLGWYFDTKVTPTLYEDAMRQVWADLPDNLKKEVMCRQNLQNCLCEFDKYMRVSTGTGRSKRKYHGV